MPFFKLDIYDFAGASCSAFRPVAS